MEVDKKMDEQIQALVDAYKEYEKDGWEKDEMVKFGLECISLLIPKAAQLVDMSGSQKKEWVIAALEKAYFAVDPNIPWVPEPVETMIEKWAVKSIIEQVVSPAIDWLVKFMKEKGLLK